MSEDATGRRRWSAKLVYFIGGGVVTAGLALAVLSVLDRPVPADPEPVRDESGVVTDADTTGTKPSFSFYESLDQTEPDPTKFMKLPGAALPDTESAQRPAPDSAAAPPSMEPKARPAPPAARPATPTPRVAPPPAAAYLVQLGAFRDPDAAKRLVQRLARQGVKASIAEMHTDQGRMLYRVRTGPFADRAAATAAAERLAKRAGLAPIVVHEPRR